MVDEEKGNGRRDVRKRNEGKSGSLCGVGGVEGWKEEGTLGKGHAVTLIRKGQREVEKCGAVKDEPVGFVCACVYTMGVRQLITENMVIMNRTCVCY